jgi:catalase
VRIEDVAEQIVDSINATNGVHPGYRAAHAKGILCAAQFTPTREARELSRAEHWQGDTIRAHVRFSNGSGDPRVADTARGSRGMGVKFYLSGSTTTDIVATTSPAFPARTPEDFLAFSLARRPDPATGQPDPSLVTEYLSEHPEAMTAVNAALTQAVPASYASVSYHALHAYGFDSDQGRRYGRYHWVPDEPEVTLTDEELEARSPEFLHDELVERLDRGPCRFHLRVQLAADGDPLDDPTSVWPDDRAVIEVGTLDITSLAFDRERDGDILVFDPTRVVDGIVLSDDAILHARAKIYAVSVARRTAPDA